MICIFNRKALYRNTDAEATAKVWSTLRENGVKYELHTNTHTSSFKRMMMQRRNMSYNMGGIPASWMDHSADYLYTVYVHKNDYERAKELCELQ